MLMVDYKDKHGSQIKEGLYTSGKGHYFRIRYNSTAGWIAVSSLNTGFYDSMNQQFASKLTPLLAAKMEVKSLRGTAGWLEQQIKELEEQNKLF